jgi:hypothetical protein
MNQIERLLSNLPCLTTFEFRAQVAPDLTDGQRWQMVAGHLRTLNFYLQVTLDHAEQILDSYRSSFWLEEKCWFVAYTNNCLFSVPHFADKNTDCDFSPPTNTTAPHSKLFYDHITVFRWNRTTMATSYRFTNVETLELQCPIDLIPLWTAIDLKSIKHLILSTKVHRFDLIELLPKMPRLQQLSVNNDLDDCL